MGMSHSWRFQRAYSDQEWARIELDAQRLIDALPQLTASLMKEGKKGLGLFSRIARDLAYRSMGFTAPIHPWRDDGSYCGASQMDPNARSILFAGASRRDKNRSSLAGFNVVEVVNAPGEGHGKANGLPHDRALMGILCLAEEAGLGNVRLDQTDMDDETWLSAADWAQEVLGRKLPVPSGLDCSMDRNARLRSEAEGRDLLSSTPTATLGAKRKPLRA